MAELAAGATRPEVLAAVGPFAGLFKLGKYRDPVLVASTDNVGTKLKLAALLDRYETVGIDVVNQSVNDILTVGAEPLFFLDYIASSTLTEDQKVEVVKGVATACRAAGCALLGGETADLPGLFAPGDFDLSGFIVGVVERDRVIDGSRIREGDVLLGLPSSGLHTNGYSLVREVFRVGIGGDPEEERRRLDSNYPGLGVTLGEVLLAPHRSYYQELRPLLGRLKGIAHVTGGGLIENVPRILPDPSTGSGQSPSTGGSTELAEGSGRGLAARLERGSWRVPPIFTLIQKEGSIDEAEMYRVFNMGLGMVLVCSPEEAEAVRSELREAKVVGGIVAHSGGERVILED
jgi:phosphoribosylformylglycinamidine cyclo-ligase